MHDRDLRFLQQIPLEQRIGLALVATVGSRYTDSPVERLPDAAALSAWLTAHGLEVTDCSPDDLVRTRELREAIYDLVEAAALHRPPRPAALSAVESASRSDDHRELLWDKGNGFHLAPGPATVTGALATIARDTADLLTGPERDRLHQCEAETCGTVFLASPGGRARRWCSSATWQPGAGPRLPRDAGAVAAPARIRRTSAFAPAMRGFRTASPTAPFKLAG